MFVWTVPGSVGKPVGISTVTLSEKSAPILVMVVKLPETNSRNGMDLVTAYGIHSTQ